MTKPDKALAAYRQMRQQPLWRLLAAANELVLGQALEKFVILRCNNKGKAKTIQHRQEFVCANAASAVFEPRQQVHRNAVQRRGIVNAQSLLFAVRSHLAANIAQLSYDLYGRQRRGAKLAHISEFQKDR